MLYQLSYLPQKHIALESRAIYFHPLNRILKPTHGPDVRDSLAALQDFEHRLSNFETQDTENRFDRAAFSLKMVSHFFLESRDECVGSGENEE